MKNETERLGPWMQTYTGKAWYPIDPRSEDVDILDIAHALSQICRYAGHCSNFYSVAEHSWLVSYMVPPEDALQGLLHDATEAYCTDVPSPLKRYLASYRAIEQRTREVMCRRFGLSVIEPRTVRQADRDVLLSEYDRLFSATVPLSCAEGAMKRPEVELRLFSPKAAELCFLHRFNELMEASCLK